MSDPSNRDPLAVDGFSAELSVLIGEGHDGQGNIVGAITRIAWLQSLLDAFEEFPDLKKVLMNATDDPDSMSEMLRECRDLARDGQALLDRHMPERAPGPRPSGG